MIKNDAKLESISCDLKIENRFFNFCVGVWVGGHAPMDILGQTSDKAQKMRNRGGRRRVKYGFD